QIHQSFEGGLHSIQVLVNIGVVELDGCQDRGIRKVVQKLRSFVEKRRIVLVAFKNELAPRTQHERGAKVFWNPSDQETGRAPGMMKQPCQQRRGRGLAVRARYYQPLAPN